MGLVSRVTPVHTAVRNCTRDEGRSFEVGNQVLISSHRKLLSSNHARKSPGAKLGGRQLTRAPNTGALASAGGLAPAISHKTDPFCGGCRGAPDSAEK
jgi:hypothetical protein